MKKLLLVTLLAAFSLSAMSGCAIGLMGGLFYADVKAPMQAASYYGAETSNMTKMGEASYTSILGIIVTGDASIERAMKSGGLTKLHHIDTQYTNILGIIATTKTVAYGE